MKNKEWIIFVETLILICTGIFFYFLQLKFFKIVYPFINIPFCISMEWREKNTVSDFVLWQLKTSECHSKRGWGNGLTNQNPPLALPTPSHIPLTWHSGTEVVTSGSTYRTWEHESHVSDTNNGKCNNFLSHCVCEYWHMSAPIVFLRHIVSIFSCNLHDMALALLKLMSAKIVQRLNICATV
jgi:hypothetical protein